MSILSKFANSFNGKDRENDDDYFYGDDYEDDRDYADDEESEDGRKARPSFFSRFSGQIAQHENGGGHGGFLNRKVVPIDGGRSSEMEVTTLRPNSIDDARDICDYLLAGKAVIMNMERINMDLAQRVIDFTVGSVYALDGNFKQVSKYIFVASPHNVELSGDFDGDFMGQQKDNITSAAMFDGGRRYGG